jgi:hypothetical protein
MRLGDYGSARLELRRLVDAGYPEFEPLIQAVTVQAAAELDEPGDPAVAHRRDPGI